MGDPHREAGLPGKSKIDRLRHRSRRTDFGFLSKAYKRGQDEGSLNGNQGFPWALKCERRLPIFCFRNRSPEMSCASSVASFPRSGWIGRLPAVNFSRSVWLCFVRFSFDHGCTGTEMRRITEGRFARPFCLQISDGVPRRSQARLFCFKPSVQQGCAPRSGYPCGRRPGRTFRSANGYGRRKARSPREGIPCRAFSENRRRSG